jgi:hypothetical protein
MLLNPWHRAGIWYLLNKRVTLPSKLVLYDLLVSLFNTIIFLVTKSQNCVNLDSLASSPFHI